MKHLKKTLAIVQICITFFVLIGFYLLYHKFGGWDYYEKIYLFVIFYFTLALFLLNAIGYMVHERKKHIKVMIGTIQLVISIALGLVLLQVYGNYVGVIATHIGLTLFVIPFLFILSAVGYLVKKEKHTIKEILGTIQITVSLLIMFVLIILGLLVKTNAFYYFSLNVVPVLYILSALGYMIKH